MQNGNEAGTALNWPIEGSDLTKVSDNTDTVTELGPPVFEKNESISKPSLVASKSMTTSSTP
jgi:hypothetical protein